MVLLWKSMQMMVSRLTASISEHAWTAGAGLNAAGSLAHGIFRTSTLEWVLPFSPYCR